MRKLLVFVLLLSTLPAIAQVRVRGRKINFVTANTSLVPVLSIVGSSSVAEGTSQAYRMILTNPNSTTVDVTATASFSVSRGTLAGKTVTNAANTVRGDDRITTLRAVSGSYTASREIVFTDATAGYTATPTRLVVAADVVSYPFMKVGDLLVAGGNSAVATGTPDYSIQIRSSYNNVPTLAPGATIWLRGGSYNNIYLDLSLSRSPANNPITVTNYEGTVVCVNGIIVSGARGVRITGKYDPVLKTGDSDYQGHNNGYFFTAGRYGILCDNKYTDPNKSALRLDGGVKDVTYDNLEIRGGYFSSSLFNDNNFDVLVAGSTTHLPYKNINLNNCYIHDLDGEGCYWGSTGSGLKAHFESSSFTNNRVLRVGNEGIQIGQLDKGMIVKNNVVHSNFNWRDPFQMFQSNALQLNIFQGGQNVENNLFLRGSEKFINGLTQGDTAVGYGTSATDTLMLRNNAFLYCLGMYESYFNTQTINSVRQPINNLTLVLDRNLFGKNRFAWDEVYTGVADQNYLMKFDVTGTGVQIRVTNNIFDGSTASKTQWVLNAQPATPITQANNTLTGTVPHPVFNNYMGLPANFDYSKIEKWAGIIGSQSGFPASGTRKGEFITVPVGEIRMRNGIAYESAIVGNTNKEPTVAANWQAYWNVLYWNRTTGAIVRNPTNLTNLSSIPPDDVRVSGFYAAKGIGLN